MRKEEEESMVLPLLKLGTLFVKTLSKPVASWLRQQAALHLRFRNLIVGFTQANHRMTTTIQRRLYSHATDVKIRPLNEQKAVQAAVDLIGELSFQFNINIGKFLVRQNAVLQKHVAGALVIFEVQRSAKSEARKEEKRREELEAIRQREEALEKEVELHKQKLAELEQLAKGRGLSGLFNFKRANTEDAKIAKPV